MTPSYLHNLVDSCTITALTVSDFTGLTAGLSPYATLAADEAYREPVSIISLSGYGLRQITAKSDVWFYSSMFGHVPVKGMPIHAPAYQRPATLDFSGFTSVSVTALWYLPRGSCHQVQWALNFWHTIATPGFGSGSPEWNDLWGVVDETMGGNSGFAKVVMHGYADVLVHATLSNSLSLPGSVYGVRYIPATKSLLPVSMDYTDASEVTCTILPMGLVRQVYRASGVTLCYFVNEQTTQVSLAPYYVARAFIGGFPCL